MQMGRGGETTDSSPVAATRGSASAPAPADVKLEGGRHRVHTVTPGVIDDRALAAFLQGQCHALALALHEETGWPIRWIESDDGEPNHCFVITPDEHALDIAGRHDLDEMTEAWGAWPEDVTAEDLRALPRGQGGWRIPDVEAARAFVPAVLKLNDDSKELSPPGIDSLPEGEAAGNALESFSVLDREGQRHELPTGELNEDTRRFLAAEQSYALAFELTHQLTGSGWRVGVEQISDDELHAYAVNEDQGVAVDAWGSHPLSEHPDISLMKYRLAAEMFDEAEYVAPDYGMAEHYAPMIAASL